MNLSIGLRHSVQCEVDHEMTARAVGSGSLDVFSTPSLLALMECAAFELAEKGLDRGLTTVGASIELKHMSPTPVGMIVMAEAVIKSLFDSRIVFNITAYDKEGIVAEATHTRFIVERKRFMRIVDKKR